MQTTITGFAVQGNLAVVQLATSGQDTFELVYNAHQIHLAEFCTQPDAKGTKP